MRGGRGGGRARERRGGHRLHGREPAGAREPDQDGLGAASLRAGDAVLAAVAVANPLGDVRAADGRVLAGVWRDGSYKRTIDLLLEGVTVPPGATGGRTGTTLVCLLTDARLSKTRGLARGARRLRRRGAGGRAERDGLRRRPRDRCMATGRVDADPFVVSSLAAEVAAAAIRDAALSATGAPGCPAARDRTV